MDVGTYGVLKIYSTSAYPFRFVAYSNSCLIYPSFEQKFQLSLTFPRGKLTPYAQTAWGRGKRKCALEEDFISLSLWTWISHEMSVYPTSEK